MDRERILASHRRMLASQLGIVSDDRVKPTKGYEVKNLADGSAEIALYDEIGPWGVSAVRFTDELRAINAQSITLRIASPGGDVADGLAILNALRAHPAMVNVIVEGWAASAASFIAMAGDTVQMAPNSMLMIHDAMTVCVGNAEEMLETAALLDKHSDNIADVYQRKAGGTVADWRQRMRDTTWYTAQEAVDAGLADGVLGAAPDAGEQPPAEGDDKKAPVTAPPTASAKRLMAVASPVHHTKTVDTAWDGNAAETALKKPVTEAVAKKMYAWYDASAEADGDLPRSACKFPHHEVDADGNPGAANLAACRNGLARLSGADIPDGDRDAVRSHLQAHLDDANSADNSASEVDMHTTRPTEADLTAVREALKNAAKEAKARG